MLNKTMFVCGADLAFKGDNRFAIDAMGVFDTVEQAVEANKELHSSFGYAIYEVVDDITINLTREFGFRQGTKCRGRRIVRKVCEAYNHPAWGEGRTEN